MRHKPQPIESIDIELSIIGPAGADLLLARTWPGDRGLERRLKRYKKAHKLCPICAGDTALHRMAPAREPDF